MQASLAIGDFARATHLSVKTLRHYHRIGLLEPADVDPATGYRRYVTEQIPTAQVIRRFRDLDMPLDDIHAVLAAPDVAARNDLIATHLTRLERRLEDTERAVASLRDVLQHPVPAATIGHRDVPVTPAVAITEHIDVADALPWYEGALAELHATLAAQGIPDAGPAGGIFADELFTDEHGQATIFVPCDATVRAAGRAEPLLVPPVELATTVHLGPPTDIDRAYGFLAAHVARHEMAVDGPIREYYLVERHQTADRSAWRTEIGWPIFHTG